MIKWLPVVSQVNQVKSKLPCFACLPNFKQYWKLPRDFVCSFFKHVHPGFVQNVSQFQTSKLYAHESITDLVQVRQFMQYFLRFLSSSTQIFIRRPENLAMFHYEIRKKSEKFSLSIASSTRLSIHHIIVVPLTRQL